MTDLLPFMSPGQLTSDHHRSQATYIESGVRGMTIRDPEAVDRAVRLFSALCAEALPWTASLDILRKASERWNMGA